MYLSDPTSTIHFHGDYSPNVDDAHSFSTRAAARLFIRCHAYKIGKAVKMDVTDEQQVEAVIDRVDGVIESAVIGVPHADFGEIVVAVVARSPGTDLTEESIIRAARKALAGYKTPKRVFLVDALPRNAMGKVQKNALRSQFPTMD